MPHQNERRGGIFLSKISKRTRNVPEVPGEDVDNILLDDNNLDFLLLDDSNSDVALLQDA